MTIFKTCVARTNFLNSNESSFEEKQKVKSLKVGVSLYKTTQIINFKVACCI